MIDFRSDTVTKPGKEMLAWMMQAKTGDDVFGEDPTIIELEKYAADLFGMEAALFCPSGTMTNQIAIKTHTQAGDEVITDSESHVYQYEGGGIAFNAGCSVQLIKGNRGRLTAQQVKSAINPVDIHKAPTRLVCLENTSNRGGGSCYDIAEIKAIKVVCTENNLSLHLDGARLFNALIAKNETPQQHGELFDSISICLSKGLGAPVGSLLLGNQEFIKKARRWRKVFGGGMRQAGFLAAAGLYALQHNIERLKIDHERALLIEKALLEKDFVETVLPVETNIIIAELKDIMSPNNFVTAMKEKGILLFPFGHQKIRMITHLDMDDEMIAKTIEVIKNL